MSGVDVLAVLKRHVAACKHCSGTGKIRHPAYGGDGRCITTACPGCAALSQTRAAVAELIAAADRAFPPADYSQDMHGSDVRAALARVQP